MVSDTSCSGSENQDDFFINYSLPFAKCTLWKWKWPCRWPKHCMFSQVLLAVFMLGPGVLAVHPECTENDIITTRVLLSASERKQYYPIFKNIPFIQHSSGAPWKIFSVCQDKVLWNTQGSLKLCQKYTRKKHFIHHLTACESRDSKFWKLSTLRNKRVPKCLGRYIWDYDYDNQDTIENISAGVVRWKQQNLTMLVYRGKECIKGY